MIGKTLGHYRIIQKIGEGGMGVVYRARDEHLGRDVALKLLPAGALADEGARHRFRKEAEALSKLNHPNIQIVHDFDTEEGMDFLVMEYIPGTTLSDKLASGPLPEKEIARLGVQLAEGLAAAHEQDVVHRDLKPNNLRVTPDGRLKILDFGLAKLLQRGESGDATQTLTGTEIVLGTLPYMSPEQLRGDPVDARTDIYATGVVLYELATARRPFEQKLATALVADIQQKAPPPPGRFSPEMSPRLEEIILKCLEKDPDNRYQSAKELAVDLRRLGALSTGPVVPSPAPARIPWRRAALAVGTAVVALVMVLVGLDVGGWRQRLLDRTGPRRLNSLAVLPLDNLSRDSEQDYFADGMTEALITNLSKISALRVISRTSVMRYKGSGKPLPQIARELNVDAVIEGSVMRSGDRVRITAQLIDAKAEQNLWADEYERDLRDILVLQSEVAQAIAQEIKIKLTPGEQAHLASARAINPEAYQLYLKGRYYWNKRTEEGVKRAIEYFKQTLEIDPNYALAYAGLADSYVILAGYHFLSPREAYPLAEAAAKKALQLDESLAEAHTPLASFRGDYEWNWLAGLKEYERAIELNPNYATARQWYAEALMRLGRHDEALREIQRAQELDPLSLIINAIHGYVYYYARRYDQAIAQFRKTLEMDANFYPAHLFLGWTYGQKGMHAEAIAHLQTAMSLPGGNITEVVASLGHEYAVSGQREKALQFLSQLKQESGRKYVDSSQIGLVYAGLGEKDQAFAWMEKAFRDRSEGLTFLKVDPRADPLRSDPRYNNLLRRMNLPE